MRVVRARAWHGLVLLASVACGQDPGPPRPSLAESSLTVQFASVDRVGPHHLLSTTSLVDERGGDVVSSTEETVEIHWQDWDRFSLRRVVDGRPVAAVVVIEGAAWVLRGGDRWVREPDPEPYRIQLRTAWNTWDAALELFSERIAFVEQGRDVVEGRPAMRYALALRPVDVARPAAGRARTDGEPESLTGTVWVDEATAVRLAADVRGTHRRGDRVRRVALKLSRSAIGQEQGIRAPVEGGP